MLKTISTAGFAMFSMFFGSGNLVFPILLGTQTLDKWSYALAGFLITAVCVPFLGLISMIAFGGDRERFFNTLSAPVGFMLTAIILLLIGPIGVIPRCISVALGGLQLIWPHLSLMMGSLIFCILMGILVWRPNNVVNIIGVVLTPFKLGGIALLIIAGIIFAPSVQPYDLQIMPAFLNGASVGYQTLDLLAAFFFSSTIVLYLKENLPAHYAQHEPQGRGLSPLMKASVMASCLGGLLLILVYSGFVKLGASFAPHLNDASPEALLAAIGGVTLGQHALFIVSITLAVSCLATAVILANLFIEFVRVDVCEKRFNMKLSHHLITIVTIIVTFGVAQLGFERICGLLGAILVFMYPAFIALALYHVMRMFWPQLDYAKPVFWGVILASLAFKLI